MYNVRLFGIVTIKPSIQWIYPNKNEKTGVLFSWKETQYLKMHSVYPK
jgi:hypothetical protein